MYRKMLTVNDLTQFAVDKLYRMRCFIRLVILVLCGVTLITPVSAGTLYKSVGPDGRIVYSEHPLDERTEKTMTIKNSQNSPPPTSAIARFENLPTKSSPLPASVLAYLEKLSKTETATALSLTKSGIVLYSATWCGYCKQAKAYLAKKGIRYQEFDIDTRVGMAAYAQAGGEKGIPLLYADGQRVQGFSDAAYDALFVIRK